MQNPNVHGLDNELIHRVQEWATGDAAYPETMRTISLNGNVEVARGAFNAAVRCYPKRRWVLLWQSYIVEKYEPPKGGVMGEPAHKPEAVDELEIQVEATIALCDGDVRAALRATLFYNVFLERKLDDFRNMISAGYTRRKVSPAQKASERVDQWREISMGIDKPQAGGGT